jgi:hypothetical protein
LPASASVACGVKSVFFSAAPATFAKSTIPYKDDFVAVELKRPPADYPRRGLPSRQLTSWRAAPRGASTHSS